MKLIKYNIETANLGLNGSTVYTTAIKPEPILIRSIGDMQYNNSKDLFNISITLTQKGEDIIDALEQFICSEFKITREELKSNERYMPLPKVRGAFTGILRTNFNFPLKLIGTHLGGRDHSSVLMSERRAKDFYKRNNGFRFNYNNVQRNFTKFLQENGYIMLTTNNRHSQLHK